jgi:phage terminase small subunit
MQQRFAEFLVFGGPDGPMTKTEAALAAGYSPKRARQEGSELTNPKLSPLVVKYIGELKEERLRKHEVTYEGHVAELARLREAALKKGSFSSAVNAEANRGKAGRANFILSNSLSVAQPESLTQSIHSTLTLG